MLDYLKKVFSKFENSDLGCFIRDPNLGTGIGKKIESCDLGFLRPESNVISDFGTQDLGQHCSNSGAGARGSSHWECVALQNDLMNNSAAGFPESDPVLCSGSSQEVVDFLVEVFCACEILLALNLGLNEMVTVDGGGHSPPGQPGRVRKSRITNFF